MIQIKIPEKTPTVNHLFWHRGNMKIMTKEARELRERIKEFCQTAIKDFPIEDLEGHKLSVSVDIYENWLTKKNDIKKKDLMNREKFLIDSVFQGLGIDDKMIFQYHTKKIQSKEEKAIIKIEVINGS